MKMIFDFEVQSLNRDFSIQKRSLIRDFSGDF